MDIFLVTVRILLAAFLGAIIGIERETKKRAAGFRTHIIVSVGACLIMLIGINGFGKISDNVGQDTVRLAAQVVSGIGFLGAGTILQTKNRVSGLTTAATLWLSAAIGLAVGIGFYEGAVIATVICLVTLISLMGVSDFINDRTRKSYIMLFDTNNYDEESLLNFASKEGVEVKKFDIIDEDIDDKLMIKVTLYFHRNYNIDKFFKKLESDYHLKSVKLSKQRS
ncbi:MAG: MgtC/SapB family protein [Peptoniphilus harei]|uniref:MgtC/SapB family protein n=1 Tax=Peptoniphilus harei TaxID=54005 RepID=UPI00254C1F6B|nr:MgtC/SapB family protein [Peptoniphilus harei]MDK7754530.1 MgtC/SapB family protein [Peptoniphilus harei]MDK7760336.1 MgtC/SapB family protein [Peptoniphilus harei]MDK8270126.1 MgtC/SapB family protein [Peptoniphilus harei]MDK8338585.1 MgtC/SapB family protein [Peptoniphilus harei]MDU7532521.1 MgtC/SapB family protein [Peptoniphilus harei]